MEILHYEHTLGNSMILPLILLLVSLGVLIGFMVFGLSDEWNYKHTIGTIVCTIAFIGACFWMKYSKNDTIVYTKIDNTIPFVEVIDKYEYLDHDQGIYKLKVR